MTFHWIWGRKGWRRSRDSLTRRNRTASFPIPANRSLRENEHFLSPLNENHVIMLMNSASTFMKVKSLGGEYDRMDFPRGARLDVGLDHFYLQQPRVDPERCAGFLEA